MKNNLNLKALTSWFQNEKRDLPWRENPGPYAVWVSEVMLQQTRVSVVIPYFLRWMQKFPTLHDLAKASQDEVIKEWEGLGYYSRARNLHEGAQYVVEHFNGTLPNDPALLKQIKGLGPYTIGAILSFAFREKAAAVDGNVIRVLTRLFGIEEDIAKPKTIRSIWEKAEEILPDRESWIVSEALIELGATICTRPAKCHLCPLQNSCVAYETDRVDQLPHKSTKVKIQPLYRAVAVIQSEDRFLVMRGKKGKIMSDLHEFPYFNLEQENHDPNILLELINKNWNLEAKMMQKLPKVTHSFTRYKAHLFPVQFTCEKRNTIPDMNWHKIEELDLLAFSSGHRQIYQQMRQHQWQKQSIKN